MSVKAASNRLGAGRPKAEDLKVRCSGVNRLGKRCGMAPIEGETVCTYHLGEVDRAVKESMAERLRQGADEAIARLRQVVRTGADADATRASEILLSRVAPKLASSQAIVVSVGGDGGVDPRQAATEVVRARLLQLAAVSAERDQEADDAEFDDGDVIDAEIVEVDVDRWGRA